MIEETHFIVKFRANDYILVMPDTEGDEHIVYTGDLRGCAEWIEWLCDFEDGNENYG